MSLLPIVLISAMIFLIAYRLYGNLLVRLFKLNADAVTPAYELRDDLDYVPTEPKFLIGQHFSAIAAAGPIVGPILACLMFGWVPALLWIIIGSIFIGGVQRLCFTSGVGTAQSKVHCRSCPRAHEQAILYLVSPVHLDRIGLHHRRLQPISLQPRSLVSKNSRTAKS